MLLIWKGSLDIWFLPGFMLNAKGLRIPQFWGWESSYKEIMKSAWKNSTVTIWQCLACIHNFCFFSTPKQLYKGDTWHASLGKKKKKKQGVPGTSKTPEGELQTQGQVEECRNGSEGKGICHQANNLCSSPWDPQGKNERTESQKSSSDLHIYTSMFTPDLPCVSIQVHTC